ARLPEAELPGLRAAEFGFVFQTFNLIPTLTAQENVETALVATGVPAKERHNLALAMLEELGLADRAGHLPSELSGGQQQRTAIARALVKRLRGADLGRTMLRTRDGRRQAGMAARSPVPGPASTRPWWRALRAVTPSSGPGWTGSALNRS